MTGLPIQKTESLNATKPSISDVQFRSVNPFGATNPFEVTPSNPFENYEYQEQEASKLEDKNFQGYQKAEKAYATASIALGNSDILSAYNKAAQQAGYGNVNTLHRHDI